MAFIDAIMHRVPYILSLLVFISLSFQSPSFLYYSAQPTPDPIAVGEIRKICVPFFSSFVVNTYRMYDIPKPDLSASDVTEKRVSSELSTGHTYKVGS